MVLIAALVTILSLALLTTPTNGFLKIGRKRSLHLGSKADLLSNNRDDSNYNDRMNDPNDVELGNLKDLVHDIKVLRELKAVVDASGLSTRSVKDLIYQDRMEKNIKDKSA